MSNLKSFVSQFVALVKGDESTVIAEKVFRKREAALQSHLATAKGDLVDKEEDVASAKENLDNARLNGGVAIESREAYVSVLKQSYDAYLDAVEALEAHKTTIAFLEAEIKGEKLEEVKA